MACSPSRHKARLVPHSNMSRILFSFVLALHETTENAYPSITAEIESTTQGRIKNLDWTLVDTTAFHIHSHILTHTYLRH